MSVHLGYLCSSESWGGLEMNHLRNAVWMKDRGHKVLVFSVANSRFATEAESKGLMIEFIDKHTTISRTVEAWWNCSKNTVLLTFLFVPLEI